MPDAFHLPVVASFSNNSSSVNRLAKFVTNELRLHRLAALCASFVFTKNIDSAMHCFRPLDGTAVMVKENTLNQGR